MKYRPEEARRKADRKNQTVTCGEEEEDEVGQGVNVEMKI